MKPVTEENSVITPTTTSKKFSKNKKRCNKWKSRKFKLAGILLKMINKAKAIWRSKRTVFRTSTTISKKKKSKKIPNYQVSKGMKIIQVPRT